MRGKAPAGLAHRIIRRDVVQRSSRMARVGPETGRSQDGAVLKHTGARILEHLPCPGTVTAKIRAALWRGNGMKLRNVNQLQPTHFGIGIAAVCAGATTPLK